MQEAPGLGMHYQSACCYTHTHKQADTGQSDTRDDGCPNIGWKNSAEVNALTGTETERDRVQQAV